jgi:hypothetical protein
MKVALWLACSAVTLAASCLAASCGAPRATPLTTDREPAPLRYHVELEDSLRAMRISMCADRLPARFRPIHREGGDRFVRAEAELGDGTRLPLSGPSIDLEGRPDWERLRCVHYEVSLVSGGGDPDAPLGYRDAVYAPTASWLWAPEPRREDARYELTLTLPEGMRSSAFFPRNASGIYVFGEAAFDFITYAAFGDLELIDVSVPGGCIEIAAVHGGPSPASLAGWMRSGADAASRSLGRLPTDAVSVIALPIGERGGRGDPLAFGMAAHGERASLLAFVWSDATDEALSHDWVAVHELTHLGHAFLGGRSAWLTEGIATYYESILRARAGWVDAETALRQLDGGMRRGERGGTGRTLRDESEARHRTGAYDRVYWAGAAVALLIDVALRAEGSSLDAAIERAHRFHRTAMTDAELLRALDGTLDGGEPGTATRIGEAWAERAEFPDLTEAYQALGMRREGDGVAFDASGLALRDALLNQSPVLASDPPDCRL